MSQSKKKILFTSHTANFQKFNRPFMRMLRQQGWEVHYASMGEEKIHDCDRQFVVPFMRSPFKLRNIVAYRQLKRIIDREQYDVIHTHTPVGSVITRLAARRARRRGTQVIYTAHGFHFFTGAPLINWLTYYPIERVMARYTDVLITINQEDYDRAKKQFKTQVLYVPGVGVDPQKFGVTLDHKAKRALRAKLNLGPSDFVITYVAEISKRKNQSWLVDTLRTTLQQNSTIHLLLVGGDSLHGKIQQKVSVYGLEKQVHFLGYRNDIPSLLGISDLYVSSSTQEGLPVNVLEALMSRLPIVSRGCRGVVELLDLVGISPANDATAFKAAVESHKAHRSLSNTHIDTTPLKQYTITSVMAQMKRLYLSDWSSVDE